MTESDDSESRGPVSRRDFLRRAGKETAETSVRLIPGARLAQTVLTSGDAKAGKPGWWQRIATWRQGRSAQQEKPAEGTDGGA